MPEVPPVPPVQVGGYGPAGGYKFSDGEVDAVIKQWEDLLADTRTDLARAITIRDVRAPAAEPASEDFINKGANPSGVSLVEQHQRMVDYTTNFITALKAAKNKITVAEQEAADSVKKKGDF